MSVTTNGTSKTLHYWNGNDLTNAHSGCDLIRTLIESMLVGIFKQQALSKNVFSHVSNRRTGAFIILHSADRLINKRLCKAFAGSRGYLGLNSKQIFVSPDRTDALLINLVIRRRKTTIANKVRTSKLLVEHHTHLVLQPSDNIEIGNVNNVISIHLLLLVNGRRSGCTLKQREYLFLLKLTFNVTLRSSFVLGEIRKHRLDARERSVVNRAHNRLNPAHLTVNELGRCVKILSLGEQPINPLNTISAGLFGRTINMGKEALLHAAITLRIVNNGHLVGMAKDDVLLCFFLIKYIMLHIFISSF